MTITVITVCYNAVATIEATIASVLSQTHPDVEYIIVDGGSADETLAVIDRYRDRLAKVISEPDDGIYDAMNKGLACASGDLITFLNADDRLADETVLARVADAAPEGDVIYGDVIVHDPATGTDSVKSYHGFDKTRFFDDTICQQATFYRPAAFAACGRFRTAYRIAADMNWLLEAVRRKRPFTHLAFPVAVYDLGGMSGNPRFAAQLQAERQEILLRHFSWCERQVYWRLYAKTRRHPSFQRWLRGIMGWELPSTGKTAKRSRPTSKMEPR